MEDEAPKEGTTTVGRTGSFRKRPLEGTESFESNSSCFDRFRETGEAMELSPPSKHNAGPNTVQDEIELHFQRSLSAPKSKRKSLNEKETTLSKPSLKEVSPSNKQDRDVNSLSSKSSEARIPPLLKTNVPPLLTVGNDGREDVVMEDFSYSQKTSCVRSPKSFGLPSVSTTFSGSTSEQNPVKTPLDDKETVTVVPSRILNPHFITDARSSTTYKVSGPTTRSVQVIDLTRDGIHTQTNGLAGGVSSAQTRALSIVNSSQTTVDRNLDTFVKKSFNNEVCKDGAAQIMTRNGSTSTPTKVGTSVNNPVIFVPAAPGGVGSAVMMQPQPFILMNPAEVPRVTPPPLIAAHNVYTGGGGNYILLSPSQTVPNSLFQVMSSAGAAVSQSSITTPAGIPASQQIVVVGAPSALPATPANSTDDNKKDDINVMPASVEDHFAKALGDQWPQLNNTSSNTVKS